MDGLPQPSRLPDPRDRRETEAWLDRRSEQLAESIARSLKKVVTSAYEKFLATLPETSIVSSLTAAGDFHAFDSIIGQWKLIYEKEIAPEIEETYLSGAMSAFTQAPGTDAMSDEEVASWARVTNDQAVSYMADATNRLSGVGDTIWTDVRSRVADAVASGMSNEELKDQIGKLSDFSEYRADTIARTETIGAYVNGDWNGAQLLGEFGPVEKVWVATGDARGREWHTEMMTESIPVDEPFDVDGEPMMYPHDPSGSAFNVVNCRCYVEFLYPGDTRPDGSVIPEPGTGAEGEDELEEIADEELIVEAAPIAEAPTEAVTWSDSQQAAFDAEFADARSFSPEQEEKAHDWATQSQGGVYQYVDPSDVDAVIEYQAEMVYNEINDGLRAGLIPDEYASTISTLDDLLQVSGFTEDVVVYRGIELPPGGANALTPGTTMQDLAFQSTSLNPFVAENFSVGRGLTTERMDSVVLEILVPQGSQAIAADAAVETVLGGSNYQYDEMIGFGRLNEVILPRGSRYTVVDQRTVDGITYVRALLEKIATVSI